jgi:hypothetical protein
MAGRGIKTVDEIIPRKNYKNSEEIRVWNSIARDWNDDLPYQDERDDLSEKDDFLYYGLLHFNDLEIPSNHKGAETQIRRISSSENVIIEETFEHGVFVSVNLHGKGAPDYKKWYVENFKGKDNYKEAYKFAYWVEKSHKIPNDDYSDYGIKLW